MSQSIPPASTSQPWLARSEWTGGRVRSTANKEIAVLWFGVVVWNALSVPIGIMILRGERDAGLFLVWVLPLFVLTGITLAFVAVRDTFRWRRFRGLVLELDPFPGSLGGHVGGSVDLPLHPSDSADLRVTLACVRVTISRSSDGSSRSESVVWSRQMTPEIDRSGTNVRARFTFEIGPDLPQTEEPSNAFHIWTVRLGASLVGADLDLAFEVPVYATRQPLYAARPALRAAAQPDRDDFPADVVRAERRGRGLILRYPAGREGAVGIMAVIFGAIFVGAGGFVFNSVRTMGGSAGSAFGIIGTLFGGMFLVLFGGLGVFLLLAGVYTLINSLEVELGGGEISATRRFLLVLRKTVRVDDVRRVEIGVHSQSGQGAKARVFYRIRAMLKDGKRLPLGDGIPGSALAERLGKLIEEETGLTPEMVVRKKMR